MTIREYDLNGVLLATLPQTFAPGLDSTTHGLAYVDGKLLAHITNFDLTGTVYALDPDTGVVLSSFITSGLANLGGDDPAFGQMPWSAPAVGTALPTVPGNDLHRITLAAGQRLTITTQTPLVGTGLLDNTLDPAIVLIDPTGVVVAWDTDSSDGRNAMLSFTTVLAGDYLIQVGGQSGRGEYLLTARVQNPANVAGRHLFYNHSAWDGGNVGANVADDAAISDKLALLPGQTASSANYSSFDKGINGLMIDIAGTPGASAIPGASDLAFKIGNSDDPGSWSDYTGPVDVSVRQGAGFNGSDRITLIFPNGAIARTWLQVTVRSDANGGSLGLAQDDVFYFGSAIGDMGNSDDDTAVNVTDMLGARNHPRNLSDPAPIYDVYDFNRDKLVNVTDMLIARNNATNLSTDLNLITAPATMSPVAPAMPTLLAAIAGPPTVAATASEQPESKEAPPIAAESDRVSLGLPSSTVFESAAPVQPAARKLLQPADGDQSMDLGTIESVRTPDPRQIISRDWVIVDRKVWGKASGTGDVLGGQGQEWRRSDGVDLLDQIEVDDLQLDPLVMLTLGDIKPS